MPSEYGKKIRFVIDAELTGFVVQQRHADVATLELNNLLRVLEALVTAEHALQSYAYGNSDPTLAKECVTHVRAALAATKEPRP